jgi:hypothetical protein
VAHRRFLAGRQGREIHAELLQAKGFAERDWSKDEPRPVMYLKKVGAGEVLYFTLGHARGHYDMRPMMDEYPTVERGSWPVPTFKELLRRSLRWAAGLH